MIIRDLTLRSATSFGSFHLIRLLYDEYMFYLVEQRVAQAVRKTPVAVMTTGELSAGKAHKVQLTNKTYSILITHEQQAELILLVF